MTYGPFVSFAPVGEGLLTASAGLRPLGPVLGVCAYGKVSDLGAPRYDGSGPPGPEGIYEACVATGLARLGDEARMRGAAFVGDLDFRFPVQLAVALEATGAFSAGGTAYAHPSRREPALTNLSGGEIARLLLAGWAPAGLCLGHAFWYQALGQRSTDLRASLGVFGRNVEHPDFTDALARGERARPGAARVRRPRVRRRGDRRAEVLTRARSG